MHARHIFEISRKLTSDERYLSSKIFGILIDVIVTIQYIELLATFFFNLEFFKFIFMKVILTFIHAVVDPKSAIVREHIIDVFQFVCLNKERHVIHYCFWGNSADYYII